MLANYLLICFCIYDQSVKKSVKLIGFRTSTKATKPLVVSLGSWAFHERDILPRKGGSHDDHVTHGIFSIPYCIMLSNSPECWTHSLA